MGELVLAARLNGSCSGPVGVICSVGCAERVLRERGEGDVVDGRGDCVPRGGAAGAGGWSAALYRVAGLVRPVDDLGRIERMYASANPVVLTAGRRAPGRGPARLE